jgi:hypothetical protein
MSDHRGAIPRLCLVFFYKKSMYSILLVLELNQRHRILERNRLKTLSLSSFVTV